MPVNRPHPAPAPAGVRRPRGDGRLYLRDQDLNEGAALIRAAARKLANWPKSRALAANISAPEMDVLQEVFDLGAMDVGDLRARLGAPKQSLARNLNQLEGRGFVTRETDPRDRRRRLVTLTARRRSLRPRSDRAPPQRPAPGLPLRRPRRRHAAPAACSPTLLRTRGES